jgi:hypothetical protein
MKIAETAILLVPGFGNSGEEHWLSGWEKKFPHAQRVKVADFNRADRASWVQAIVEGAEAQTKPVMIIAHSLGVAAVAHAARALPSTVRAAWLVALSDWNKPDLIPGVRHDFGPLPRDPLPFPSQLIASRNDPFCDFSTAEDYANAWGSHLIDAGEVGHLNIESGHGPWPEGMMRFATFLSRTPAQ